MKLILFDIDGTLIETGGAGLTSLNMAFYDVLGVKDAIQGMSLAGKTDPQIIKEIMKFHKVEVTDNSISDICNRYVEHLNVQIHTHKGKLKPGIKELLDRLVTTSHKIGLLTGNIEQGAKIKLTTYGINEYFLSGAFGSDNYDRNLLVPEACRKFREQFGLQFNYSDCIIIGDTPRDVYCAKPHGAKAIAVATGPYSIDELSNIGADMVLSDLSDTDGVIRFIDDC